LDQNYFDEVDINNIVCFLRACQLFPSFDLQINNEGSSLNFKKNNDLIQFSLELTQFMFDELIHEQRISTVKSTIISLQMQTNLKIFMKSKSINDEKTQKIARSIKNYQNVTQLNLYL
ncbi:hypothetical protein ABPG72_020354, partial [Tetrahymena utriculariae]